MIEALSSVCWKKHQDALVEHSEHNIVLIVYLKHESGKTIDVWIELGVVNMRLIDLICGGGHLRPHDDSLNVLVDMVVGPRAKFGQEKHIMILEHGMDMYDIGNGFGYFGIANYCH